MEMEIEALAALRLNHSPRRYRGSRQLYDDESAPSSPYYRSAPASPSPRDREETPLGEVLAAVPFDWELRPGTPKRGRRSRRSNADRTATTPSRSPSPDPRHSRQSSASEFDFSSARFAAVEDTHDAPIASADQLFFHGQLLPLRLPPRLQAMKQLRDSPAPPSSDEDSLHGSFRSPRSTMQQVLSFRGRSKSPVRPLQGPKVRKLQKFRSLSPLRIFKREDSEVSISFSEKSTSGRDSASSTASSTASSSAFSASSSGDEANDVGVSREFWPSFEEKERNGKALNEFLFSDKPPTSPKIDVARLSSKEVLSKAERFMASEEGLKLVTVESNTGSERKGLTPQLSRSNARSISRSPIIVSQAQTVLRTVSKQRDPVTYPKRFGILTRCLGFAPPSPRGF